MLIYRLIFFSVQKPDEPSLREFLSEIMSKCHNLKPESERPRPAEQPERDPQWLQIYNQFQEQKQLRKSNKNPQK